MIKFDSMYKRNLTRVCASMKMTDCIFKAGGLKNKNRITGLCIFSDVLTDTNENDDCTQPKIIFQFFDFVFTLFVSFGFAVE